MAATLASGLPHGGARTTASGELRKMITQAGRSSQPRACYTTAALATDGAACLRARLSLRKQAGLLFTPGLPTSPLLIAEQSASQTSPGLRTPWRAGAMATGVARLTLHARPVAAPCNPLTFRKIRRNFEK